MSAGVTPQDIVERALAAATADGCVVLLDQSTSANLRWANNTLTTNGVTQRQVLTAVATVGKSSGTAAGVVSRSASTVEQARDIVAAAEEAARRAGPAEDAQPLSAGETSADWADAAAGTSIGVFETFAPALGEAFRRAGAEDRILYGFVEHDVTTTYLGSSTGLRRRHVQPTGHIGITGKDSSLTKSAWVGAATKDFTDIDPLVMDAELAQRLGWADRHVDLPAGRYDTVLPPTAVADLTIYAYWSAAARDAYEGQSVFSDPSGGTRVGQRLSPRPVRLFSDPAYPGLECAPFVVAHSSGSASSVFDNGLDLSPTAWIDDGTLAALLQTRHSAAMTGLETTPGIDNLVLSVGDATGSLNDMVAEVDSGLLLTCLWYIRPVDEQTLLLTGLTRDGVYLVEGGEVTAAVNNFRFNESPVDLLSRFGNASLTVPAFSREWGDYFPRTAMPALRVPDFNMSSVSQAS
jgi:predicted Zn-dependent protease